MNRKKAIQERRLNRRQFLMGAGATVLSLPPLLSLMSNSAAAATLNNKIVRSVIQIRHLGINRTLMNPTTAALAQGFQSSSAGLNVRYKMLNQFASSDVSYVVDPFFKDMFPHMNLLEGLSMCGGNYQGHNNSILAGAHSQFRNPTRGKTIDVILEESASVYKPGEQIARKAIRLIDGPGMQGFSYDASSGTKISSDVLMGDKNLFNALFGNLINPLTLSADDKNKELVVDKVYADLKSLENDRRISKSDKILLDRFISGIHDLQKKIVAQNSGEGPSCSTPTLTMQATKNGNKWKFPSDWGVTNSVQLFENYYEMIKLAFACDLTRVVYIGDNQWKVAEGNPTHGGLHHECPSGKDSALRHKWSLERMSNFAKSLRDFSDPLDPGSSLLDNSILLWTNELGDWTTGHSTLSMPAVTFGKGGGFFNTGYFVDYSQSTEVGSNKSAMSPGRPYKQLLQSIMQSMGVTQAEYTKKENGDGSGFGEFIQGISQFGKKMPDAFAPFKNDHNGVLPFITKA